jgi:hypothetical protein
MRRTLAFVMVSLFVLALTANTAHASGCPNLLNYQGRLTESDGTPVADEPHSFTFALFTTPTGGSPIWSESIDLTTTDGLFTHLLGSVTALPADLFPNNDQLFIETTADGETMTTRTQIVSVGYARRVNTVDGSSGGSIVGDINLFGQIESTGMQNKIRFHYDNFVDLPDPVVYHGMFAHVHNDAKAYYAHDGAWVPIANELHEHTSAWTDFPFAAGYNNNEDGHPTGGFWQRVQYRKIGDIVYVRGYIHKADHGAIPNPAMLGTLPIGFRPPAAIRFRSTAGAYIQVESGGDVFSVGGPGTESQHLDGTSFSTSP